MITDPWFYFAAVPAVLIFGISKGGFGGGLGVVAVPMMALVISPIQAAAIMLPILCIMDLFAMRRFRGQWIWPELKVLVPASLIGIGIGTLLFEYMSPAVIRLIVGTIAIVFTLHYWFNLRHHHPDDRRILPRAIGLTSGVAAGFTSFIAHAGGPPVNMYLLRRSLNRTEFVATTVFFFAVVNYVKLIPYAWLGQFDTANLATALILSPLAPIGIEIGHYLHRRISEQLFFSFIYVMLFAVGAKLIYDGTRGICIGG
ncbi:MAG: TSUP family transporter [Woeseiaceae bacterium]|nr:TSUP family transporter [Woeseiaceae bacterium]